MTTDLLAAAVARIDPARLRELAVGMTSIPSPTGDESALAGYAVAELSRHGVAARLQPLDERQANAVGRIRGSGSGPVLLLYAPIDTLTTGTAADVPAIGATLRSDMLATARVDGDLVTGLGAGNPKGHAACVTAAAEVIAGALQDTGERLQGDLVIGLGAGGMPINSPVLPGDTRCHTGQGAGCSFLLEQGVWPDAAVVAKPGWSVSWEEVGLAWFDVTVHGRHTYVGSRHKMPYRNAIAAAGVVVQRLEDWFEEYAARHTDGLVSPQGIVGAIAGGWLRMPAVTPASCTLRIDLRLSPRTSPAQARRELLGFLDTVKAEHPDLDIDVEPVLAIPGATTDRDHWIARRARHAWEAVEGGRHADVPGMSGATDATILRNRGIPTVRVGMPKVPGAPSEDFQLGMNTVDVGEMARLTACLVRLALDVCTTPLAEIEEGTG